MQIQSVTGWTAVATHPDGGHAHDGNEGVVTNGR